MNWSGASFALLKDLQRVLIEAFQEYTLSVEAGDNNYKIPDVIIGHAPSKGSIKADPPFLIISPFKGTIVNRDNLDWVDVTVNLFCCVYRRETIEDLEAGYNDMLNMIDLVYQTLNKQRKFAGNQWILNIPLNSWSAGLPKELDIFQAGSQSDPFYYGVIECTFSKPALKRSPLHGIVDAIDYK